MTKAGPDFELETGIVARLGSTTRVCGVDEAGRGPLAVPVLAAAVVLDAKNIPKGLNDSKKLSPAARIRMFTELQAAAWIGVGAASVREIDHLNILRANDLAMRRAIDRLPFSVDWALIDGNRSPPDLPCGADAIVKGDGRCLSIAAASIVAKVIRDRIMDKLAARHPAFGWSRNSGYPTAGHRAAIAEHGVTAHHRRSFRMIHR